MAGDGLGRRFGWLWAAFTVSTVGTWLAFDAFPLVAVIVLHAGAVAVSVLAAGPAVAAGRTRLRPGDLHTFTGGPFAASPQPLDRI